MQVLTLSRRARFCFDCTGTKLICGTLRHGIEEVPLVDSPASAMRLVCIVSIIQLTIPEWSTVASSSLRLQSLTQYGSVIVPLSLGGIIDTSARCSHASVLCKALAAAVADWVHWSILLITCRRRPSLISLKVAMCMKLDPVNVPP